MAGNTKTGTKSVPNGVQLAAYSELKLYLRKGVSKTPDFNSLGKGSFGSVMGVQACIPCAEKIISRFTAECQIMSSIRHPKIVQFLGLGLFPYPTLVMEQLVEDLCGASEKRGEVPLSLKASILSGVANGLAYPHSHNTQIITRDLTSQNILLALNVPVKAKIVDLGHSLIDSHTVAQEMTQSPGRAIYMPLPEDTQAQGRCGSVSSCEWYVVDQSEFSPVLYNKVTILHAKSEMQRPVRCIADNVFLNNFYFEFKCMGKFGSYSSAHYSVSEVIAFPHLYVIGDPVDEVMNTTYYLVNIKLQFGIGIRPLPDSVEFYFSLSTMPWLIVRSKSPHC